MDYKGKVISPKPSKCKICGKRDGPISWKGYCPDCGCDKAKRVAEQMIRRKGYYFKRWRAGMKRALKREYGD